MLIFCEFIEIKCLKPLDPYSARIDGFIGYSYDFNVSVKV